MAFETRKFEGIGFVLVKSPCGEQKASTDDVIVTFPSGNEYALKADDHRSLTAAIEEESKAQSADLQAKLDQLQKHLVSASEQTARLTDQVAKLAEENAKLKAPATPPAATPSSPKTN